MISGIEGCGRPSPAAATGTARVRPLRRRGMMLRLALSGSCSTMVMYYLSRHAHARRRMTVIEYKNGDLLAEKADALVNAVNCVGNMGVGIALQFRKKWSENFRAYTVACRNGQLQPGRMFTFETRQLAPPRYIINFPTKRHWRSSSRLEDIDAGLGALVVEIRRLGLDSIAVPPLGAGLGGLPWKAVRERIERALGALPRLRVVVFGPRGAAASCGSDCPAALPAHTRAVRQP